MYFRISTAFYGIRITVLQVLIPSFITLLVTVPVVSSPSPCTKYVSFYISEIFQTPTCIDAFLTYDFGINICNRREYGKMMTTFFLYYILVQRGRMYVHTCSRVENTGPAYMQQPVLKGESLGRAASRLQVKFLKLTHIREPWSPLYTCACRTTV